MSKAEAVLREGLERHSDVPELYSNLAHVLNELQKMGPAKKIAMEAVAKFPDNANLQLNMGAVHKFEGRLAEARECFEKSASLDPSKDEAWRNLAGLKNFTDPNDPQIEAMRKRASVAALDSKAFPSIHFALGKALEDLELYDDAFAQYKKGNQKRRKQIQYQQKGFEEMVDQIIERMGEDYFAAPAPKSTTQERPILVVGMPRSGSTLIEQILASHPAVAGTGENPDLGNALSTLGKATKDRIQACAEAEPDAIARVGRTYLDRLRHRAPDADRITDKFLLNFLHLGFLSKAVPGARFIHSRREAMDNAVACYKVLFTSNLPFAYDLEDLGHFHVQLTRLMEHWNRFLGDKILTVDYEEMVRDQEGQSRRLLEFLDLPWDPACLNFFETQRTVHSASSTQVRQPIYQSSVEKWKSFEQHLDPLKRALADAKA